MTRLVSLLILILLVIALGYIFFQVMVGFFLPLFLALVLTILFRPLHERLTERLGGRDRIAAGIMTLLILLVVVSPLAFVIYRAAVDLMQFFQDRGGKMVDRDQWESLIEQLNSRFDLSLSSKEVIDTVAERANAWFGPLAAKTPSFLGAWLINSIVLVFSLYYFLADGDELMASSSRMLPLDAKYQRQLTQQFADVTRSVVSATVITALVQGIGMAIGYYFSGAGVVLLLMMLTMFASFVPAVGSAAVWLPVCGWLLLTGHVTPAILLAAWCSVIVLVADNIVRPALLHGQSNIHPLLALLSVIGGVEVLGPVGLFVGPMAVAFLQTGLKLLNTEIQQLRKTEATAPTADAMVAQGQPK